MSAPMVRALLAGTKTQTRRAVKLAPAGIPDPIDGYLYNGHALVKADASGMSVYPLRCPYGAPGDKLWVRETHCFCPRSPSMKTWAHAPEDARVVYGADDVWLSGPHGPHSPKMRPSIHMPRWASRITLEVTGVRVERLQDISEADAMAEGCIMRPYRHCYEALWESINGPGSWDANPFVWVVSFTRVGG